jgi:hypothetical protein
MLNIPPSSTRSQTGRKSITRPEPDTKPPKEFRDAGGMEERVKAKRAFVEEIQKGNPILKWFTDTMDKNPGYLVPLLSAHPRFLQYSREKKIKACNQFILSHPKLLAEMGKRRNEMHGVPNHPTSSRMMKANEQNFLTRAMLRIQDEVKQNPFRIHGEFGAVGFRNGDIAWFGHNPKGAISMNTKSGGKYNLHSHPPFGEPFTSSASEADHLVAVQSYLRYDKMNTYVTNGKDVLQIQPDSMKLVKLIPDPKFEENLGKFPEAFRPPEPQKPPRAFSSHEAPAAFRGGWQPPATWAPPQDYPRARAVPEVGEASSSRKRPLPPHSPELESPAKRKDSPGPSRVG